MGMINLKDCSSFLPCRARALELLSQNALLDELSHAF